MEVSVGISLALLLAFTSGVDGLQCHCYAQGSGAILETYKSAYIDDRRYCDAVGLCKSFAGTGCVRLTAKLANLNGSVGFCNALQGQIVEFAKSLAIPALQSCEDQREGICYCDQLDNCNKQPPAKPKNQSPINSRISAVTIIVSLMFAYLLNNSRR